MLQLLIAIINNILVLQGSFKKILNLLRLWLALGGVNNKALTFSHYFPQPTQGAQVDKQRQ